MKETQPIKRHKALQPLSREHHHGLLLSWKIRAGLKKNVEAERVRNYSEFFFTNQLLPHFEIEEAYLFPILGKEHRLVIQAVEQHRQLELLFKNQSASFETLNKIADLLEEHIRFEERVLFNEIQKAASAKDLEKFATVHPKQARICAAIED